MLFLKKIILAGIVYNKITRPDHLNDLLTLPSNKGARPKSAKNQKKSQSKQKPVKAEGQVPPLEKYHKSVLVLIYSSYIFVFVTTTSRKKNKIDIRFDFCSSLEQL